ncbi:MAG: helix-turn-helix transcriptional regulator, partial [Bacteroidota bacterium]
DREQEVLHLICLEYSSTAIADNLCISKHTVDSHRKNILQKTGVRTLVGLIRWALEHGFMEEKT